MKDARDDLLVKIKDNRFKDIDLQLELCDRLYDLASGNGNKKVMGEALFYKGEALVMTEPDKAEKYIHSCIRLLEDTDYELIARAYNILGIITDNRDDLSNSLNFYLKCFQICEEHNLNHVKGLCACNIGVIFQMLELYEKSSGYFKSALECFKKADESEDTYMNIVTVNLNLFIDYFNMRDLENMKECFEYIVVNRKYLETQFSVELFKAEMMYIAGNTDKLDETLEKAVEESKEQQLVIEFLDSYVLLCDFLYKLKKYDILLEELDLIENQMTDSSFPRIRIKLIKYRLTCIGEKADFDEYKKWTKEYIKTYELITYNYHQSIVNSIQLRMYIEVLKDSEQVYENMAMTDGLTKLYNRYGLKKSAKRMIDEASEKGQMIGVAIIDIDYFKQVNDYYGHSYGDECLKSVAEILRKCCPLKPDEQTPKMILSRYGGDEFVVIIQDVRPNDMEEYSYNVKKAVIEKNMQSEKSPVADIVTLSQGMVCRQVRKEDELEILINEADKILYDVKENGRNGYKIKTI